MPLDLEDPEIKEAFDKAVGEAVNTAVSSAVEEQTRELKSKNEELIGEKRKLQETVSRFDGIDLEKIQALQKQLEGDEETQLLADGKVDEVFNRRFEKFRNDYESKLADANKKVAELEDAEGRSKARADKTIIEINLRRAAEVAGVLPSAIDDVVNRGVGSFTVDPDQTVVQRDSEGALVTIDGKNSTPEVWMADLQEKAPHFWPPSKGGDLGGNDGGEGGGNNAVNQMAKAAAAGDMDTYREVRNKMRGRS